ncbi:MAG: STAS domain-containing protein [Planctomycetes bacterium]|nr:STAS domain-containing protein [Planctomycetota bacterium]
MCAAAIQRVEVAQIGDTVLFRITGLGSVAVSPAIMALAEREMRARVHKFAFDMSRCSGMDSTFMGTLVALAQELSGRFEDGWVCMVNTSEKLDLSLQNLGAAAFLRFKTAIKFRDLEMEPLDIDAVTQEERLAVIRRAHEHLMDVDKRNMKRFGSFLDSLTRELDS